MEELQKKLDQLGEAFAEFKKANDARIKAIESKGYAPAELEQKTDRINDDISRLEGEIKNMRTAMNRTGGQNDATGTDEKKEILAKYQEAQSLFIRKGVEIPAELKQKLVEMKAMSVDSDEDGGFLVTPQMSSEIVQKIFESSPMRALSSVQTISTDSLEILQDLDEVGSGWVGETQTRPTTSTPKLDKISIPVHELYAQPAATQKFLDDAGVNVESWLAGKVSEKFSRDEATGFISGNGVAKPRGILSYANGTGINQIEQMETASASVIVGDDLVDLSYKLKGDYKNGSSWLCKRTTIATFRKLKDSEGRYLWEPGLNGATQSTLLGFPINEAEDMPAVAASALAVAFGNFKAGYQIVDRIGIRVLRDPYTAKPYVLFYTTKRVGGGVKNFEAIKLLKVKAP